MDELLAFIKSLVGIDETNIEQYTSAGMELIKNIEIDGMTKYADKYSCHILVNGVYLKCNKLMITIVINNKIMHIDNVGILNSYYRTTYVPKYDKNGKLYLIDIGDYLKRPINECLEWLFDQKTTKSANKLISC